tara:strand:+ start:815 stop:2500 length:1686 start_codon:yes stop_codon:yes gene_type:complete
LAALWFTLGLGGCMSQPTTGIDYDGDNSPDAEDCSPIDPTIYPGAPDELGDGIDQNCDGTDGIDTDGDGVPVPEDCDDTAADRYPGAPDSWNDEGEFDENCDGLDGIDQDRDGYPGDAPEDDPAWDCNDDDGAIHPGAQEDANTPADDNCDGLEGDVDQDGHQVPEDCDDSDAEIHPGATELCDAIDQDCDGDLVELFADLDTDGMPDCSDDDVDGDGVLSGEDCDDLNPSVGSHGALSCPYPWVDGVSSCHDAYEEYGAGVSGDDDDSAAENGSSSSSAPSGFYEILLAGTAERLTVYCDMERWGGGWTLVLIAADDGVDTWTWSSSQLLTNIPAPIGDLAAQGPAFATAADFKSPAYHELNFSDLLFVHHSAYPNATGDDYPFETWAAYDEVGDGSETLPMFMLGQQAPSCLQHWIDFDNNAGYINPAAVATPYPMSAGTLALSGTLCDTNLYFHLGDHNTYAGRECFVPPGMALGNYFAHSYGPAWAAVLGPDNANGNCGSGPGWSSLGLGSNYNWPNVVDTLDESVTELPGLGFGMALGLNVADSGTGINHLRMYLR